MKNKKGNMVSDHTGAIIIAVVLLVILFVGLMSFRIPQKISILFGSVPEIEDVTKPIDGCPYKVGYLSPENGDLVICLGPDCVDTKTIPIAIIGSKMKMIYNDCKESGDVCLRLTSSPYWQKIGHVYGAAVIIDRDILYGSSDRYNEIKQFLPTQDELVNINGAFFYNNKYLCRGGKITFDEYKRGMGLGLVKIDGKTYYYNLYDVTTAKDPSKSYPLYKDENLKEELSGYRIDGYNSVIQVSSDNQIKETDIGPTLKKDIVKEVTTSSDYQAIDSKDKGFLRYKILNPSLQIQNSDNKLAQTGGDPLIYIDMKNIKGELCMRFTDNDFEAWFWPGDKDSTDWFTVRYWNAYGKFPILPEAICHE